MTEAAKKWVRGQARFNGIFDKNTYKDGRFERTIPMSSVPRYEECGTYIREAYESGCDGGQTKKFEEELAKYMGIRYAVAVNSGQAALQLALKLTAEKLYGSSTGLMTPNGLGNGGCLQGRRVFCSDLTTADMVSPIVLEGGEPVFIDCSDTSWMMDPEVLSMAFEKYPDVKIVVLSEPYGFPGDVIGIRKVCFEHEAVMIECAGDSFGAKYWVPLDNTNGGVWGRAGVAGDCCVLDFGKGKPMGMNGGALLVRDCYESEKVRYWADRADASTPWNQHEELGYRCAISDLDAALLRGGLEHMDETIEKKKKIYDRYYEKLNSSMAYIISSLGDVEPSCWMTALMSESNLMFNETRNDRRYTYTVEHGTAAPMEIYDALSAFNAECSPVYKPMSMQPLFRNNEHFTLDGAWRCYEDFSSDTFSIRCDQAKGYYECGIVLPSDISMTEEEQDKVIDIVYACYDKADLDRLAWA